MDFFKKAQDFAASANTNDDAAAPASGGGFGSLMSGASDMLKAQNSPADAPAESAAPGTLPGRQPPTNAELLESSKLLFGAAQGGKVENSKLAGAAEDLLGGLAAHGKLDQGKYASYIDQAEEYLHKYSGQDAVPRDVPAPEATEKEVSEAPAVTADAPVKPRAADEVTPERVAVPTSAPNGDDRA